MTINTQLDRPRGVLLEERFCSNILPGGHHSSTRNRVRFGVVGEPSGLTQWWQTVKTPDTTPGRQPRYMWIEDLDPARMKNDTFRRVLLERLGLAKRRQNWIGILVAKVLFALFLVASVVFILPRLSWGLGLCLVAAVTLLCYLLRNCWYYIQARRFVATAKAIWLRGGIIDRTRQLIQLGVVFKRIDEWEHALQSDLPVQNLYAKRGFTVTTESVDEAVRQVVAANPELLFHIGEELGAEIKIDKFLWLGLLDEFILLLSQQIKRRKELYMLEQEQELQRRKEAEVKAIQAAEDAATAAKAAAQAEARAIQARAASAAEAVGLTPEELAERGQRVIEHGLSSAIAD